MMGGGHPPMNEAAYHAILRRLGIEPSPSPSVPSGPREADRPPLADRVTAFRQQLAEWVSSGRLGVPVLTLPGVEAVRSPDVWGCLSCAAPIPTDRLRCDPCRQAVELALGLGA